MSIYLRDHEKQQCKASGDKLEVQWQIVKHFKIDTEAEMYPN